MKKLIALLIITGFFVVTMAGCPTQTTSGGKMTTGPAGSSAPAGGGAGASSSK